MSLRNTQLEFNVRYYLWATMEFEKEIEHNFPNLQRFRTGPAWSLYQFISTLGKRDQLLLARSLLHRFHSDAVRTLGEPCISDGRYLRDRLDIYRNKAFGTSGAEMEIDAMNRAGRKMTFISKRKLLNITAQRFQSAFGVRCVESGREETGDPRLEFHIKCSGGWIISTHFWFGRGERLLDYGHTILTENAFEQHGPKGIFLARRVLGTSISFCSWLGICSQTQWEYLTDIQAVDNACNSAIKFCERFIEVAPKLLEGLESDKVAQVKKR